MPSNAPLDQLRWALRWDMREKAAIGQPEQAALCSTYVADTLDMPADEPKASPGTCNAVSLAYPWRPSAEALGCQWAMRLPVDGAWIRLARVPPAPLGDPGSSGHVTSLRPRPLRASGLPQPTRSRRETSHRGSAVCRFGLF
jgi:hypothetical protein